MRKRIGSVIIALVAVLAVSFLTVNYVLPMLNSLFSKRTYSQTNNLTEMITNDMDIYDIAKSYRDGQATVSFQIQGYNNVTNKYDPFIGSGVCVASKGYETSLESGYVASKGSYIATNYHVINLFDNDEYSNVTLSLLTDKEESYSCDLLWFDEDLDVAVVYCDYVNLNYVSMKDRSIACAKEDKLDYEPVFAIGTPLDTDYLNRLTIGNIASDNSMFFYTGEEIYPEENLLGQITDFTKSPPTASASGYQVLSNVYEDGIDVALGISGGNSGGGCFDENGYLIGLATLSTVVEETNGNQMNGVVPIYPITKVLDKLIENNETSVNNKIYNFQSLGLFGFDAYEAGIVTSTYEKKNSLGYYYIDENLFASSYKNDFAFDEDGYYILKNTNSSLSTLSRGCVIKSVKNGEAKTTIYDRNDLIYFLLEADKGDSITIYFENASGADKTLNITL